MKYTVVLSIALFAFASGRPQSQYGGGSSCQSPPPNDAWIQIPYVFPSIIEYLEKQGYPAASSALQSEQSNLECQMYQQSPKSPAEQSPIGSTLSSQSPGGSTGKAYLCEKN